MPYLLQDLIDGELPNYSYVGAAYEAQPGEVLLSDAEFESKPGWVWDATAGSLRAPTDNDRLRWAKQDAERRIEQAAVLDMQDILHVYRAVAVLSRNNSDPRLINIRSKDDALNNKITEIRNSTPDKTGKSASQLVEDVNAIDWES